ncbi:MAG TPA: hypothetical protein VII76_14330 [Acidimicrobiales bacterium]
MAASSVALLACATGVIGGGGALPTASAAAAPSCVFKGPAIGQLVLAVSYGESININCENFPANHPYLLVEASLLVAVDPAAKPLLDGQATSVPGLLAIIAALPELNPLSVAFPTSNSSGVLNYNYTVPSSQPPDPNAKCPPTTIELNAGLIGCAVAMIDLESFKPVVVGTMVLTFKGQSLFATNPTLFLTPNAATVGQHVAVSDFPGAQTYWWLSTLVSLEAGLSGGGGSGPIPVLVKAGGRKAFSKAAVAPATYNGTTFTPPKLSGYFIAKVKGRHTVNVFLKANLLGIGLSNSASAKIRVSG